MAQERQCPSLPSVAQNIQFPNEPKHAVLVQSMVVASQGWVLEHCVRFLVWVNTLGYPQCSYEVRGKQLPIVHKHLSIFLPIYPYFK